MAGVQMGRADLEPVAVGWERSRRRCVCPRRYGQTRGGRDRTDEDARKLGRAFQRVALLLCCLASCYSAMDLLLSYLLLNYLYSTIGIPDQPSLLGCRYSAIVTPMFGAHVFLQRGTGAPDPHVFSV